MADIEGNDEKYECEPVDGGETYAVLLHDVFLVVLLMAHIVSQDGEGEITKRRLS